MQAEVDNLTDKLAKKQRELSASEQEVADLSSQVDVLLQNQLDRSLKAVGGGSKPIATPSSQNSSISSELFCPFPPRSPELT